MTTAVMIVNYRVPLLTPGLSFETETIKMPETSDDSG